METRPQTIKTTAKNSLFIHWSVETDVLKNRIPDSLTLDTYDGSAWMGLTSFRMSNLRPRGLPSWVGVSFPELHVRTYVRDGDTPGIFLFSLDIGNQLVAALARRVSGMPYYAAAMQIRPRGTEFRYTSQRRQDPTMQFDATYAPTGEASLPAGESFEHWFLTREHLFGVSPDDILVRTDITLQPGPLHEARASIHRNTLFQAADVPLDTPRFHYRDSIEMTSSTAKPVMTSRGGN